MWNKAELLIQQKTLINKELTNYKEGLKQGH